MLLRTGNTAEALEVADAARGGALREHLAANGYDAGAGAVVQGLSEGEGLLRRIDTLVSRMDALEATPPKERDGEVARALLGETFAGIVVTDRSRASQWYPVRWRPRCWAPW